MGELGGGASIGKVAEKGTTMKWCAMIVVTIAVFADQAKASKGK